MSERRLRDIKTQVLEQEMNFLCEELGDPGRYFPHLRSKGLLDDSDCQNIRSKVTARDKTQEMIEIVKKRVSTKEEHSFDVLVDAFKKQRVQAHIARGLQKAFSKAKVEAFRYEGIESKVRDAVHTNSSNQLPSENKVEGGPYEIHPLHGALPPPAVNQTTDISGGTYIDEQPESVHPQHGVVPSESPVTVAIQQESGLKPDVPVFFNGSESELGGQSQPSSIHETVSSCDGSFATSTLCGTTSSFTTSLDSSEEESLDVTKLKVKIKHLTDLLHETQIEIKKKDALVQELYLIIEKAGLQHELEKVSQPKCPYNIQVGDSLSAHNTTKSAALHVNPGKATTINEKRELQRTGQDSRTHAFNSGNFISRYSGTLNASISIV